MTETNEPKQPKIFVACPIGSEGSLERARADQLMKFVIHPVVKDLLNTEPEPIVVRADKMSEPGRITMQILRELGESDVVIADVTGTNPNVMYEVGIRQALMRPFVLMCQKEQNLPFDINDLRTVFYTLDLEHVEEAQAELRSHLDKSLAGTVSPVDKALFSTVSGQGQPQSETNAGESLLAVMEMCQSILRETQEVKAVLYQVGGITMGLAETHETEQKAKQEKAQQEMGMWMMQQLMQNPDGAEKVIPVMEALKRFGEVTQPPQKAEPMEPTPNRAARRKQQKG